MWWDYIQNKDEIELNGIFSLSPITWDITPRNFGLKQKKHKAFPRDQG